MTPNSDALVYKRVTRSSQRRPKVSLRSRSSFCVAAFASTALPLVVTSFSANGRIPAACPANSNSNRSRSTFTPQPPPALITPNKGNKRRKNDPPKRKVSTSKKVARTKSFGALSHGSLNPNNNEPTSPHTLILGTHPSITSLNRVQYFAHPMNAFWWIAGDCLGFRRDTAISPSTKKPYAFASQLRYDNILSYEEQLEMFTSQGFCLWDIVESCQRPGSLDQDIRMEIPNDIRGFVNEHPSIRQIVFANGAGTCKMFCKHFSEWLKSGELVAAPDEMSQKAFQKACRVPLVNEADDDEKEGRRRKITLTSAIAVSPAAAGWTYQQKRDFWEANVYRPGLQSLSDQKETH